MTTATIDHEAQSRGIKRTIFALLALIALIGLGFFYKFTQPRILSPSDLRANNVWVFETARIPRDFVLLDERGETATNAIFEGKWTLIFFGFTNCPDICPSAMAQMRDMQTMLRDQGRDENVQYMLVSVDPDRDTPDVLGPYVEFFDPSFRALTGEYLTIKQLATDFNVAFSKVPGGGEFYSVDHSGNIAIVNPYGHYQGFIRPPFNPGQMVLTFNSVRASWRG